MLPTMDDELDRLLIGAGEAPPDRRIEFRDPIAEYGRRAVERLEPWLGDSKYAWFAIRTIAKAASFGALQEAIVALEKYRPIAAEATKRDIEVELGRLAPKRPPSRSPRRSAQPRGSRSELTLSEVYRRKDLHDAGWGGNRRRGISYPAGGDHALLFSDPATSREYGYKDTWDGTDRYRYYGEWNGAGDMTMTVGNAVIRDRSPNLHLFTMSPLGYRYQGQFRYVDHYEARTERQGRSLVALVFLIERVGAD
jgi:hypothetical protein